MVSIYSQKKDHDSPNQIDIDDKTLIINISGRLERHSVERFITNGFEFVEPTGKVQQLNNEKVPNFHFQHIYFSNNELVKVNFIDKITVQISNYIANS